MSTRTTTVVGAAQEATPATGASGTGQAVLELRGLTKRFGETFAVEGVSLDVQPGEVFTLLGPSGCGKSTTLRLIAGLEHPDGGEIRLRNQLIASARSMVPPDRRGLGMVFQSYAIWPHMTVAENVAFPLKVRRSTRPSRAEIRRRVSEALDMVGLSGLEERPSTQLSGGQQQRVALARAIINRPDVLLLDEPLSNLDATLREQMRGEIKRVQRELNIAVVLVTHDQTEALMLSDRVAVMNAGKVEQLGAPADIYERPTSPFVRDFLGRVAVFEATTTPGAGAGSLEIAAERCRLQLTESQVDGVGSAGRPVHVVCKLEDLRIDEAAHGAAHAIDVVVEDVLYLGDRLEYKVRTPSGRELAVFGPRRGGLAAGTRAGVVIDPHGVTVWDS
ncbi:ABC transporter ATP-binding protein [Micromonospora globispora]|uniref:ABC transporter ATP-binding protein n=1 Tax=Micromonospora globispora TaxID=1450148 RepID=UPI001A9CA174|nr:ABC transporter ATP-binding protein [Micromonospora globispora]